MYDSELGRGSETEDRARKERKNKQGIWQIYFSFFFFFLGLKQLTDNLNKMVAHEINKSCIFMYLCFYVPQVDNIESAHGSYDLCQPKGSLSETLGITCFFGGRQSKQPQTSNPKNNNPRRKYTGFCHCSVHVRSGNEHAVLFNFFKLAFHLKKSKSDEIDQIKK